MIVTPSPTSPQEQLDAILDFAAPGRVLAVVYFRDAVIVRLEDHRSVVARGNTVAYADDPDATDGPQDPNLRDVPFDPMLARIDVDRARELFVASNPEATGSMITVEQPAGATAPYAHTLHANVGLQAPSLDPLPSLGFDAPDLAAVDALLSDACPHPVYVFVSLQELRCDDGTYFWTGGPQMAFHRKASLHPNEPRLPGEAHTLRGLLPAVAWMREKVPGAGDYWVELEGSRPDAFTVRAADGEGTQGSATCDARTLVCELLG